MNMQTQPMISVTKEKSRASPSGGRGAAGLGSRWARAVRGPLGGNEAETNFEG